MKQRRPKPWPETNRQGRTRYLWRFERQRFWTAFFDDPEEARADATTQITEQLKGSWQERSGCRMLLEEALISQNASLGGHSEAPISLP